MNNRINIPSHVAFTRLEDVEEFIDNFDGTVTVTSSGWKNLPIKEGSVRMIVESRNTASGHLVTTSISGSLKDLLRIRCKGLLSVTMCGNSEVEKTYIIGTPDLPVSINLTMTLTRKTFQITHKNVEFPQLKAI